MLLCSGCACPLGGFCFRPYGTTAILCRDCRSYDGRDFAWVMVEPTEQDDGDDDDDDEPDDWGLVPDDEEPPPYDDGAEQLALPFT